MQKYSIEDRIFIVTTFFKCDRSIACVRRAWTTKHKNRPKPAPATITNLITKFERTGCLTDDKEAMKSSERTVRTPENIDKARELIEQDPSISIRNLSRSLDLSRSSGQRILREDLCIFPCKIQVGQRLEPADIARRLEFANEICEMIDVHNFDPSKIIFSDEAHFWLDGYVNGQNYRIWGSEKPEVVATKPLHPKKLTVWGGLCSQGILGPFFLHEGQTIDQTVYRELLEKAFDQAEAKGWIDSFWFQQDGATPHIASQNMELIHRKFAGRVISRNYPNMFKQGLAWPPYSPDLTPMDYFVWGFIKDKVYKNKPTTLQELRARIEQEFECIRAETLQKVMENFEKRIRTLVAREGEHIENILH